MTKVLSVLTPARRKHVYRVLVAVGAIAVFHGLVTDEEVTLYLAVVAEVLGITLANANVPTDA